MAEPTTTASPWRWLKPLLTVVVFAALAYGMSRLLESFDYEDVAAGFDQVAPSKIVLAALVVVGIHGLYVVRERLAVDFAGYTRLSTRKVATASLIARSLSTLGIATITGFALRMRIYGEYRLEPATVGRITVYNESTYYVGLAASLAVALTAAGVPPMHAGGVDVRWLHWLGPVALAAVAGYVWWNRHRKAPLHIRSFELPLFTPLQLGAQLVLPVIDAFASGLVTYLLVPDAAGLGYLPLVTVGLLASILGSLSQVPGGLGVYETAVLGFVPAAAHPMTLAALLVRRAVVNLLPIAAGTVMLLGFALDGQLRKRPNRMAIELGRDALAIAVFAGSVLSLIAAAVPRAHGLTERFGVAAQAVVFAGGLVTLVAARGLQQGRRLAWWVALALATLRLVGAIAAGPHMPSLIVGGALVVVLLVARPLCPHPGPLFDGEPTWFVAWVIALIGIGWAATAHTGSASTEVRARAAGMIVVVALVVGRLVQRALPKRGRRRKRESS